jgi:uncharacterized membrane protein
MNRHDMSKMVNRDLMGRPPYPASVRNALCWDVLMMLGFFVATAVFYEMRKPLLIALALTLLAVTAVWVTR